VRTLKLTLEYDGTAYVGWQRQPQGVSIQGLLEESLAAFEGGPVAVHGAGRTDAGVHALGQVASFRTRATQDAATFQRALNAILPADVRVVGVEEAAPGFHARFDASSKTYEYRIVNAPYVSAFAHRYVWHVPGALDVAAMRAAAAAMLGRHDFAAFRAVGGNPAAATERTITAIALTSGSDPDGGPEPHDRPAFWPFSAWGLTPNALLTLRVTGNGFLRHMVRTMAGTLVDVGLRRWPAEHVAQILAGRDRTAAGRAAPAGGLFLVRVDYRRGAL
jgi:tRNA pseudouridine38-40 synthase